MWSVLVALSVGGALAATSPGTTSKPTVAVAITECPKTEFLCTSGNGLCIPEAWLCDDVADCDLGEDERGCENGQKLPSRDEYFRSTSKSPAVGCSSEEFKCNNYNQTWAQCVPREQLCDGDWDCEDGSDEGGFCGSCAHYGCEGGCRDNPALGPVCTCDAGEQLGRDGKSCEDVDECRHSHPCNHRCENLVPGFRCHCAEGYTVAGDQRTCLLNEAEDTRLYVSFNHRLKTFALPKVTQGQTVKAETIRATSPRSASIPGLDAFQDTVFLAANPPGTDQGSINQLPLDQEGGTTGSEILQLVENIPGIANVAVDWVTGLIYYVATNAGQEASIGMCTMDGRFCGRFNLSEPTPHRPRGLVVHPQRGLLFWSDWGRSGPRIEAASMDGAWRDPEFVVEKLEWPNALALDFASERLYWGDAQIQMVESLDLHSLQRKHVISDVHHPYDLAVFDNVVYWTDWAVAGVQAARLKADGSAEGHPWLLSPGHDDELHYGLALRHTYLHSPILYNPCQEANCSHICALAPDTQPPEPHSVPMGGVVAKCLCPLGYTVDPVFPDSNCILDPEADWAAIPRLADDEFERRCSLGTACENGGVCLPEWKRRGSPAAACHCPWGYSGRYCEIDESRRWAALGQSGHRSGAGLGWLVALIIVALALLILATLTAYYSRSRWSSALRKSSVKTLPRIPSVSFFRGAGGASPLRSGRANDEERQHIVRMEDGQPHVDQDRMDSFENPGYDHLAAASAPASPVKKANGILRHGHHSSVPAQLFPQLKAQNSADDSGFETAMDSGEHGFA